MSLLRPPPFTMLPSHPPTPIMDGSVQTPVRSSLIKVLKARWNHTQSFTRPHMPGACVCVYMCVHTYVCVHVHMCVPMCIQLISTTTARGQCCGCARPHVHHRTVDSVLMGPEPRPLPLTPAPCLTAWPPCLSPANSRAGSTTEASSSIIVLKLYFIISLFLIYIIKYISIIGFNMFLNLKL